MSRTHIIVDCGATSAKIAIIKKAFIKNQPMTDVTYHRIDGFNPNHQDWHAFQLRMANFFKKEEVEGCSLSFYGAGLGNNSLVDRMKTLLVESSGAPRQDIEIHSDLMACAHAVYRDKPVVVGILGTGSNVAFYDGLVFSQKRPSLGYLLGDEGSGVDLGKALLKAFCYRQLPKEVMLHIKEVKGLDYKKIIERTYDDNDLRAMASEMSPVAHSFYHLPQVKELIDGCFDSFLRARLGTELETTSDVQDVYLFGSVAVAFQEELKFKIESRWDVKLNTFADPLKLLVEVYIGNPLTNN